MYACTHISIGEGRAKRQDRKEEWASHCRHLEPFSFPFSFHIIFLFILFFNFYFLLSYNTFRSQLSLPSSLPAPPPLLSSRSTPPPRKKQVFQGCRTKHSTAGSSKIRHKPSHQGWVRQPSRRKGSQEQGKESETLSVFSDSTVRSPPKRSSQQP